MNSFLHELDCGDIIYGAATVQAGGGGQYFLKPTKPVIYTLLKDLFDKQEYADSFKIHQKEPITHDFSTFRRGGIPFGKTLGELHAKWVGIEADLTVPWLRVNPSRRSAKRIVVARSPRYQNPYFPWANVTAELADKMLFIGLEDEWRTFCYKAGKVVEYVRTANLLQAAELIAGSELFIGNQSSPYALCEGLKHASVQETSLQVPDCIYPRKNGVYCCDGKLSFEFLGKRYEFEPVKHKAKLRRMDAPAGGWVVMVGGKEYRSFSRDQITDNIGRDIGRKNIPTNIEDMIDQYTIDKLKLEEIPPTVLSQMNVVNRLSQFQVTENSLGERSSFGSAIEVHGLGK